MALELGGISLTHLVEIRVQERARVVRHAGPGIEGDYTQMLGRSSVVVHIEGIFYGADAFDQLSSLREAYLSRTPVDFFTEIVGEGYLGQVVIASLHIAQRAGYLDQFSYACSVIEYVEPPEPVSADPFSAIDTELAAEAASFMDDVQNALDDASGLLELLDVPSFGDPTEPLSGILGEITTEAAEGATLLTDLLDLF